MSNKYDLKGAGSKMFDDGTFVLHNLRLVNETGEYVKISDGDITLIKDGITYKLSKDCIPTYNNTDILYIEDFSSGGLVDDIYNNGLPSIMIFQKDDNTPDGHWVLPFTIPDGVSQSSLTEESFVVFVTPSDNTPWGSGKCYTLYAQMPHCNYEDLINSSGIFQAIKTFGFEPAGSTYEYMTIYDWSSEYKLATSDYTFVGRHCNMADAYGIVNVGDGTKAAPHNIITVNTGNVSIDGSLGVSNGIALDGGAIENVGSIGTGSVTANSIEIDSHLEHYGDSNIHGNMTFYSCSPILIDEDSNLSYALKIKNGQLVAEQLAV